MHYAVVCSTLTDIIAVDARMQSTNVTACGDGTTLRTHREKNLSYSILHSFPLDGCIKIPGRQTNAVASASLSHNFTRHIITFLFFLFCLTQRATKSCKCAHSK